MTRPVLIAWVLATVCLRAIAGEPVWHAVGVDGSATQPTESVMQSVGDTNWPGWSGLWMDALPAIRENPVSAWRLLDGQCVVGGFDLDGNRLGWRSPTLGLLQIDLELTRAIGPLLESPGDPPKVDQLVLVNGDRVEGFLNGFDPERGIGMERRASSDAKPEVTWHPFGSVTMVRLSGKSRPSQAWRLWLRDGSQIDVAGWHRDGSTLVLQNPKLPGAAPRVNMPWSMLQGVRPMAGAIMPMAAMTWQAEQGETRGRLDPARVQHRPEQAPLDLRRMELAGPGVFVCTLPTKDMWMHLVVELPAHLRDMGGCTVRVQDGSTAMVTATLDADHPSIECHGRISGDQVRIDVQPGPGGALGSVLTLRDAWATTVTAPPAATPPATNAPAEPGLRPATG